ncbi:TMV resistance protein N-like [Rutidosis leptorrhynchoides]|uniref:TMV resistance protein N-like n=1 Tax=Rutidosis leptorrhynchoides TaxID=125765 RepID=UPI003A98F0A6
MASSSSSAGSWKYDVFISFRGEDTRKNYVDHLYKALSDKLISTYKDDESLVDSNLRGMPGGSCCASNKQSQKTLWTATREACRVEVNRARRPCGQQLERHEAAGIKVIVDTILEKLIFIKSDIDDDLVGMGTRLQSLKSLLDFESGGVHMVGIWGVGGIGKTTLAYSAYQKISRQFDGHCYIDQIREESGPHGLKKLQEKILSTLLKKDVNVQSVEEGKNMIRGRLSSNKVLIVLDDIDKDEQIEALAGSHEWFGSGSRIIITTRDEHLLKRDNVRIYHARLLSDSEAIQLFNKHAVLKDKSPTEDYYTLSWHGLPLALKVLGPSLRGKDKKEWLSALEKMENNPNRTIMDKLKISYDGLDRVERELFLDIACFHRGNRVDRAKDMLDACKFYPDDGIRVLSDK